MIRSLIMLSMLLVCQVAVADEIIQVDGGKISGTTKDGVRSFKGIPYAAPPIGDLRWRQPQPVVAWEGVRQCNQFGSICPQLDYPAGSIYQSAPEPQSEKNF